MISEHQKVVGLILTWGMYRKQLIDGSLLHLPLFPFFFPLENQYNWQLTVHKIEEIMT